MRQNVKHFAANAMLALVSLTAGLAFVEFVVFGMLVKPDDVIANVSINGVVRYEPGRVAVFRHPDGRSSEVRINRDGWNSSIARYEIAKPPGRLRIAIIGDSYVHASYVDTKDAFPEVIARRLQERGIDAEVLRFGMDGAPLSQYLHVLRTEVARYSPDVVLVQLIHNDFDESFRFLKTRYASSFMKLDIADDGSVREIAPADFEPTLADLLRTSATFRYIYYETDLYLTLRAFVSRHFWGGDEAFEPEHIVSGVDVRNLDDPRRMSTATRYVVSEMQKLARRDGFRLALAIDAVRETVYGKESEGTRKALLLNEIAADAATKAGVPLLDLTATFRADYAAHRERFEYPYDWHWNERANVLVGRALADWLLEDRRLIGLRPGAAAAGGPAQSPRDPG